MIRFHAVLADECGGEFGADVSAYNKNDAYVRLREMYPESEIVQLESPEDTARREKETYDRAAWELDNGY